MVLINGRFQNPFAQWSLDRYIQIGNGRASFALPHEPPRARSPRGPWTHLLPTRPLASENEQVGEREGGDSNLGPRGDAVAALRREAACGERAAERAKLTLTGST